MQIIGIVILAGIIAIGFAERAQVQVSAFDLHALVMVIGGCVGAVVLGSTTVHAFRTFTVLAELLPFVRGLRKRTGEMEQQREQLIALWHDGKRTQALALADESRFPAIQKMVQLVLNRSPEQASAKIFLELRHDDIERWQPSVNNWEMLSKLGPAFGMVGTITGMIQMFRNMSAENMDIGAAMSLALVATLYGVAFGAGVAGPIGHFLSTLLDERLGFYERCEKSVNEIVSRPGG
jgi:chemotaxis protein MotA